MKYKKSVYKSFAMITQLSIHMLVPIFLCSFVGICIDKKFGTYFVIPLFFLGALAGFRNVYIAVRNIYSNEEESGHDDRGQQ
ncbi:MAG: AtpZ/AtpI family protein [Lachnospiraceae bacterium]|nr:AtpZ/AtpI family protein [Lachnospiraceae bacterium]